MSHSLQVGIVGGGVTGIVLALGLRARGIDFTVYERAQTFKEIGAGFSFGPSAQLAMDAIDPNILAGFKAVATPTESEYMHFVDGLESGEMIYQFHTGGDRIKGCRRADLLQELVKLLPMENVKLGTEVVGIDDSGKDGIRLTIKDQNGFQEETCDAVVGCDGIWSRVRQAVLGDTPAANPHFSHSVCYRALVPMEKAKTALGVEKTSSRFVYNGPGAHCVTYPVGRGSMLNVLVVVSDPNPWQQPRGRTTSTGSKSELTAYFRDWHATVRVIVDDLLPEQLDTWALFDHFDHPAPFYNRGALCLAGDAAHTMCPHLGTGAGMGVEDAAVLSTLLECVSGRLGSSSSEGGMSSQVSKADMVTLAFRLFNDVRYERSQWAVRGSRHNGDIMNGADARWKDGAKFGNIVSERLLTVWDYDIRAMISDSVQRFEENMRTSK